MSDGAVREGLTWVDPVEALARFDDAPYTLLLYGGGGDGPGRYSYLCAFPDPVIETANAAEGFAALRAGFKPDSADPDTAHAGFKGGYAGLLGYDLARAFEAAPQTPSYLAPWPLIAMGWYHAVLEFDHLAGVLTAQGDGDAVARLKARLAQPAPSMPNAGPGRLDQVWSDSQYAAAVKQARAYVRAGDVFQVNLSHPFRGHAPGPGAPLAVFKQLAQSSSAAFSAYFRLDEDRVIVTNSPERFIQVFSDGRVQTRPIKGTRPRRKDPAADRSEAEALLASIKDRAENLMIVDLMRNDLSRVCEPGSVQTPELFKVEGFANVHHLVSTINGRLHPDRDMFDLIAAAFPPGSITGAPKVRAMEIIAELEGESRGPYCGALGWIGFQGAADLNVMIRTAAFVRSGAGWDVDVRSGGAITIDSDPYEELEETWAKAAALKAAIEAPL